MDNLSNLSQLYRRSALSRLWLIEKYIWREDDQIPEAEVKKCDIGESIRCVSSTWFQGCAGLHKLWPAGQQLVRIFQSIIFIVRFCGDQVQLLTRGAAGWRPWTTIVDGSMCTQKLRSPQLGYLPVCSFLFHTPCLLVLVHLLPRVCTLAFSALECLWFWFSQLWESSAEKTYNFPTGTKFGR